MSYDNQEIRSEIKSTTSSREAVIFGGVKILEEVVFRLEAQKPTYGLYHEEPEHTFPPGQTEVNGGKFQPEPSSIEGASQYANLNAPSIADMQADMAEKIK